MAGCGGSTQEKQITGLNAVTTDAQVSTSACSASEEQKGSDAQGAMAACIMCDDVLCRCPRAAQRLQHCEESLYENADGSRETFLRVIWDEDGNANLGCCLCMAYLGKDGVKEAGGHNKIANGKMRITDKISADTVKGHIGALVRKPSSDKKKGQAATGVVENAHARAVAAYKGTWPTTAPNDSSCAAETKDIKAAVGYMAKRCDMRPSQELLNTFLAAYWILKKPMSEESVRAVCSSVM